MNSINITDKILQLEAENRRLQRAVEELSILNEIATAISSTLALDQIVVLIVQKCVKHLKVEQAAVMILAEKKEEKPFQTMVRRADTTANVLPYRLNAQLTGWMLKHQKPLVINDFPNDDRFQGVAEETFPIQSLLSVPLLSKGRMIGVLTVFNKKAREGYSSEDQRLLTIIATQSTQVIENARLLKEEQTLIKMREEIRLAHDIQSNLLPKKPPQLNGYDIAGESIPAQVVGGDYFDFIPVDENRLAFCLGDVSGKGLPAALLMANLQATIRGQTIIKPSPKDCLRHSNKLLYQSTESQKFVTLFYGILDSQKHQLRYSNAGHNSPLLFSEGEEPVPLETGGVVLSFMENFSYDEGVVSFNPGDLLLIYSDGITEAMDAGDEEFGEERLAALVKENMGESASGLIEKVITAVKRHAGDSSQMDDMTLVVIQREKSNIQLGGDHEN
ncbi:SpoIIE family protein phosphatase [candidate division KSB1 bacterium]|nr:SpoIIE family protein phosphatase [candidate division KSB1 bacterium]